MRQVVGIVVAGTVLAAGLSCSSKGERAVRVHQMGELVQTGPLIYNVIQADWQDQLGEGAEARAPEHRFLVVRLSVTNSGVKECGIPSMALIGADNQSHPEQQNGKGVPQWLGYLRSVKPAATEHGSVLFDVPHGAYKLRVADEADDPEQERAALIDIPYQIRPDVRPELPQAAAHPEQP